MRAGIGPRFSVKKRADPLQRKQVRKRETERRAHTSLIAHRPDAHSTRLLPRPDAALASPPHLRRPCPGAPTARPLEHAPRRAWGTRRHRRDCWGEPKKLDSCSRCCSCSCRRAVRTRGQQEEGVPALSAACDARSARCCARAALRTQTTSFTHSHPTHICNALLQNELATGTKCSWLRKAALVKRMISRRRDDFSPHSHAAHDQLRARTPSQPPTSLLECECHRCKVLEDEDTKEGSKESRTGKGGRNPLERGKGECPPPLRRRTRRRTAVRLAG